jgi:uncharacterized lipoprotein NlpE involved in copper resistance
MSDNTWKVNADGDWATVADWSLGRLPDSADAVTISTTNIHYITHSTGSDIIDRLVVGADYFTLSGGSLDILTAASFADGYTQTGGVLTVGAVSITGAASLLGGASEGAASFTVTGNTSLSNYTLGGGSLFTVSATANETGQITLGDTTGVGAKIKTLAAGVYDIGGDFGILGANSAMFTNAGTLEKGSGSGVSAIDVSVASTGTVSAASGQLQFDGPTNSFAATLSGAGEIAFGAGVTTLSATSVTAATLGLYNTATLNLDANLTYSGAFIDGSDGTSTLNLGAETLVLAGATASFTGASGSADISGSGILDNKSLLTLNGVVLGGTVRLNNYTTIDQTGVVTLGDGSGSAPTIINLAKTVYDFTDDSTLGEDNTSATFNNEGTLEKTKGVAGQSSVISLAVINSGTISAEAGVLNFDDTLVNTGTIAGAGTVEVSGGGAVALNAGTVLSVADFDLFNTSSLTLGASFAYAGVFNDISDGDNGINLGANTLTLTGDSNTFQGNFGVTDIAGTGVLANKGEFSIGGAVIDGTTEIDNTGWINQDAALEIGGGGGQVASIINASGARFNVAGAFTIDNGTATGSNFTNSGTVVVSAGTGTAAIATRFNNLAGGTLKIATGALDNTGILVNDATISGTQLILGSGGQTTFNAGSVLSVAQIDLYNTALLTLGTSLTYAGDFVDASDGNNEINLGAGTLTLSGQSEFDSSFGSDVVTGTGALDLTHASLLEGASVLIGGSATLNVESTLTVTGGLQVGDSSANAAKAAITAKGVYHITADASANIGRGSSAASTLTNAGLFEKTAGTGTTIVSVDFVNNGTITVTSGTLEFLKGTLTNNGTINGTVTFDTSGDELITAKTPAVKTAVVPAGAAAKTTTMASSLAAISPAALSLLTQAAAMFGVDHGTIMLPDYVAPSQAPSLALVRARRLT